MSQQQTGNVAAGQNNNTKAAPPPPPKTWTKEAVHLFDGVNGDIIGDKSFLGGDIKCKCLPHTFPNPPFLCHTASDTLSSVIFCLDEVIPFFHITLPGHISCHRPYLYIFLPIMICT